MDAATILICGRPFFFQSDPILLFDKDVPDSVFFLSPRHVTDSKNWRHSSTAHREISYKSLHHPIHATDKDREIEAPESCKKWKTTVSLAPSAAI